MKRIGLIIFAVGNTILTAALIPACIMVWDRITPTLGSYLALCIVFVLSLLTTLLSWSMVKVNKPVEEGPEDVDPTTIPWDFEVTEVIDITLPS